MTKKKKQKEICPNYKVINMSDVERSYNWFIPIRTEKGKLGRREKKLIEKEIIRPGIYRVFVRNKSTLQIVGQHFGIELNVKKMENSSKSKSKFNSKTDSTPKSNSYHESDTAEPVIAFDGTECLSASEFWKTSFKVTKEQIPALIQLNIDSHVLLGMKQCPFKVKIEEQYESKFLFDGTIEKTLKPKTLPSYKFKEPAKYIIRVVNNSSSSSSSSLSSSSSYSYTLPFSSNSHANLDSFLEVDIDIPNFRHYEWQEIPPGESFESDVFTILSKDLSSSVISQIRRCNDKEDNIKYQYQILKIYRSHEDIEIIERGNRLKHSIQTAIDNREEYQIKRLFQQIEEYIGNYGHRYVDLSQERSRAIEMLQELGQITATIDVLRTGILGLSYDDLTENVDTIAKSWNIDLSSFAISPSSTLKINNENTNNNNINTDNNSDDDIEDSLGAPKLYEMDSDDEHYGPAEYAEDDQGDPEIANENPNVDFGGDPDRNNEDAEDIEHELNGLDFDSGDDGDASVGSKRKRLNQGNGSSSKLGKSSSRKKQSKSQKPKRKIKKSKKNYT
eukprot:gb/GECH01010069.1/.p1 GENE.gb/GECH01010069.1/~~gb/GECH01010069.1/.p1  ORF type:complete len:560 (+),score=179.78 gb/GECH01010069.1/:1-1680(+)